MNLAVVYKERPADDLRVSDGERFFQSAGCVCAGLLDVNGLFSAVSEEEFLGWHSDILEFRCMLLDV